MAILRTDEMPRELDAAEVMPAEQETPAAARPRFQFVVPGVGPVNADFAPRQGNQRAQTAHRPRALLPAGPAVHQAPARPRTERVLAPAGSRPTVPAAPRRPVNTRPIPTASQKGVIDDDAEVVAAMALSGSGKTTTSIGFAEARPNDKFLYVCFAKANADEAKLRFPRKVDCRTGHSIAYLGLDPRTRARVPKYWNARTITDDLQSLTGKRPSWNEVAVIGRLFQEFFADTAPVIDLDLHSARAVAADPKVSIARLRECAQKANVLWEDMKNLQGSCRIPHDGYLKRFILGRPNLGFDRIIFEEAQDANPLMAALVLQQREYGSKLLIIGDEHQSIYKFRGAYNIFNHLPTDASVHTLTETWRFGPETAEKVNLILAAFKPHETARVVGCGQDRPWSDKESITYLARTNAKLFEMAVAHVESKNTPIYWVGGIGKYRVHMLLDAYALWEGRVREVNDEFFRGYLNWDELRQYAESTGDPDAKILHALVEKYRHRIPDLVERIDSQVSESLERAAIGLGTGHGSKGLEFPQVELCDDFDKSFERALTAYQANEVTPEDEQEINLLYVALSRAKFCVRPNPALGAWMDEERLYQQEAQAQAHSNAETMSDRP